MFLIDVNILPIEFLMSCKIGSRTTKKLKAMLNRS